MNYVERAVEKAGGLKKLAAALGVDYQQVQYWRARGYVSSYKGSIAVADYLKVPFSKICVERAEAMGHVKMLPDT